MGPGDHFGVFPGFRPGHPSIVTGRPSAAIFSAICVVAGRPAPPQRDQRLGQGGVFGVKSVPEQVKAAAVVFHGQLDAGHQLQADGLAAADGFRQPAERVMVGDRQRRQPQRWRFETSSVGDKLPSEAVVCACRSIPGAGAVCLMPSL